MPDLLSIFSDRQLFGLAIIILSLSVFAAGFLDAK